MFILKIALMVLCVGVSLMAFFKPFTKEKFFFLFVTLLLAWSVLGAEDKSPEEVTAHLNKTRTNAIVAQAKGAKDFAGYYAQVTGGGAGKSVHLQPMPIPDVKALREISYDGDAETKPLYRRRVEVEPLGRVAISAPRTPGIDVLTGHSTLGPEIQNLPTREPLGVLNAPTWQAWVVIGSMRADTGNLALAREAFERARKAAPPDKIADVDAYRRQFLNE